MKRLDTPVLVGLGAFAATLLVGVTVVAIARRSSAKRLAPGSNVILLGDSIGVGLGPSLSDALGAAGSTLTSYATVGWNARQTASLLRSDPTIRGDVAVVSLGSNDAAMMDPSVEADDVAGILDMLTARGAARIVWVVPPNFASAVPPLPATKDKQAAFAALWGPRGSITPERYEASPDAIGGDGIHLSPSGYAALGQGIAAFLVGA